MGFCGWICFGFCAGLVARAVLPGDQNMGIVATVVLGIAGSLLGGFVGEVLTGGDPAHFQPAGFVGAVLGAVGILAGGEILFRGSRRRR